MAAWLLLALVAGTARAQRGVEAMPLVAVDDDDRLFLEQADKLLADGIKSGNVSEAVRVYHELLTKRGHHPFPISSGYYVSLGKVVTDKIGELPPDVLNRYRELYDSQAQTIFQQAQSFGDRAALRRVVSDYLHTSYGADALDMLGGLQFDHGEFARAAREWDRILQLRSPVSLRRELILAKSSVAWHLANVPTVARKRLDELKAEHADARAVLEGREQNVVAFVEAAMGQAAPRWAGALPRAGGSWTSLAGAPDGQAVMEECRIVVTPRWKLFDGEDDTPEVRAMTTWLAQSMRDYGSNSPKAKTELIEGRVRTTITESRHLRASFTAPLVTHPAIVDDTIIVRQVDDIVAYNVFTGEEVWRSMHQPLERSIANINSNRNYYYGGNLYNAIGETGRQTITAGDGMVFAVGEFLPSITWQLLRGNPNLSTSLSNTSKLFAVSLVYEGKIVWEVGGGRGDDDTIKGGKFLCAPTFDEGRLYTVLRYQESYYAVCLNARTGELLWKAIIGQAPPINTYDMGAQVRADRGSPPAVAQGKVFVTTNAGLVAAFGADTGQCLWAFQYPITDSPRRRSPVGGGPWPVFASPNPLIVSGDRLIVLPADSAQVLALSTEDGSEIWCRSANGQDQLVSLRPDRILLTCPDLLVLDVTNGSVLYRLNQTASEEVFGRPAVTSSSILVSTPGALVRVNCEPNDVYRPETIKMTNADAMLGNLYSVGGKLLAAGCGHLCVYMGFDDSYQDLTRRMAAASGRERIDKQYERGLMSLGARRFDLALDDLQAVSAHAVEGGEPTGALAQRVHQSLYRLYTRAGETIGEPEKREEYFKLADQLADTPASKAEMLVRYIRHHEDIDQLEKAVQLAQQLADEYGDIDVRDAERVLGEKTEIVQSKIVSSGQVIGQEHVKRLIEIGGRRIYAAIDAQAKQTYDQAVRDKDVRALLAAQEKYPQSEWADRMLFAAAELLYLDAITTDPPDDSKLAGAEGPLVALLAYGDSKLLPSGKVGQAMIVLRRTTPNVAKLVSPSLLAGFARTQKVKFADFEGTIQDVFDLIDSGRLGAGVRAEPTERLELPLRQVYRVDDASLLVLRDCHGQPVRLGNDLVLLEGASAIRLDVSADEYRVGKAIRWKGMTGLDLQELYKDGERSESKQLIGQVFDGGAKLAVIDKRSITVLSTSGGRVLYNRKLSELGIDAPDSFVADRHWAVFSIPKTGELKAVDLNTGKIAWFTPPDPQVRGTTWLSVANEVLLQYHNGGKTVRCYDLRQGGKLIFSLRDLNPVDAALTPDGLLVVGKGGMVILRDPRDGSSEPKWQVKVAQNLRPPRLIGINGQYVAVLTGAGPSDDRVQVFEITDGGKQVCNIAVPKVGDTPYYAHLAEFVGDRVYLTCGTNRGGLIAGLACGLSNTYMPAYMAYDMKDKKVLWGLVVPNAQDGITAITRPLTIAQDHLVTLQKPNQANVDAVWIVLERQGGKCVQQDTVPRAVRGGANSLWATNRYAVTGQPVVEAGRLVVEHGAGITVLGSKDKP